MKTRPGLQILTVLLAACMAGAAQAARPGKVTVTFPDRGAYSYWLQLKSGAVSQSPKTVSGKPGIEIPNTADSTLYILDGHTGQVAARNLSGAAPANAPQIAIAVSDFHAIAGPATAAPAGQPAPQAPPAAEIPRHGLGQVFSYLLSLIVAGAVIWFLVVLVKSRGEPLIALARRAGVDVPDPTALDEHGEEVIYKAPAPRVLEKVPDEAGVAPVTRPTVAGARLGKKKLKGSSTAPTLVGLDGLASGMSFPITGSSMTIGRDRDNGIMLPSNTVSRCHARVELDNTGQVTLIDQESANGIFINGMRVERAVLAPGDEVKIGGNYFRFDA